MPLPLIYRDIVRQSSAIKKKGNLRQPPALAEMLTQGVFKQQSFQGLSLEALHSPDQDSGKPVNGNFFGEEQVKKIGEITEI